MQVAEHFSTSTPDHVAEFGFRLAAPPSANALLAPFDLPNERVQPAMLDVMWKKALVGTSWAVRPL